MNKKILIPALALTLLGAAAFGTSQVAAQVGNGQYPAIVQKIADKFNLNVTDVQTVFDETRQERQTQQQANFEQRLTDAVTSGKITEAQKQLLFAKHQELQAQREQNRQSFQNLTPEERHTQMDTKRTEMEQWAKDNNIDMEYLMFGFGGSGHRGGGMMMGKFGIANPTIN